MTHGPRVKFAAVRGNIQSRAVRFVISLASCVLTLNVYPLPPVPLLRLSQFIPTSAAAVLKCMPTRPPPPPPVKAHRAARGLVDPAPTTKTPTTQRLPRPHRLTNAPAMPTAISPSKGRENAGPPCRLLVASAAHSQLCVMVTPLAESRLAPPVSRSFLRIPETSLMK
jgi:hypothetical protein